MKKVSIYLFVIILIAISCRSIDNISDNSAPEIFIYHLPNGGGNDLIASTNPSSNLAAVGCPIGTSSYQLYETAFVTEIQNGTVSLNVTSSDSGGVRNLKVILSPINVNEVTNVQVWTSNQQHDIEIVQSAPLEVKIDVTFVNLRTAQILTFDVSGLESVLTVKAESSDFNNHTGLIPDQSNGIQQGQIADVSVCEWIINYYSQQKYIPTVLIGCISGCVL